MDKNKRKRVFLRQFIANITICAVFGVFLLPKFAFLSDITAENIVSLTNKEREKAGLEYLVPNAKLNKAAEMKAQAILKEQKFSHDFGERKFSAWVKEQNYDYSSVGENLAIGFDTAEGTIQALLKSESHRRNLLNPNYEEIGLAVIEGVFNKKKQKIVVQLFGTRMAAVEGLSRNEQEWPKFQSSPELNQTDTKQNYNQESYLSNIAGPAIKLFLLQEKGRISDLDKEITVQPLNSNIMLAFLLCSFPVALLHAALTHYRNQKKRKTTTAKATL